jgi:hypothetical protein
MPLEIALRVFALPRLDQEQRDRAGRMDRKTCDAPIETRVTPFAAVGVAAVRAQRADALKNSEKVGFEKSST